MFKGFEQKYPEYEIITPQTKLNLTVRSLTTSEELKIKTSLVNKNTLTEILNKILYDCIVNKPEDLNNYNNFLKNITLADRDALFIGWYHASYGNIVENIPVSCPKCDTSFPINYDLSAGGNLVEYSGKPKEILKEVKEVHFDIAPGFVKIKCPTLQEEIDLTKSFFSDNQEDEILNLMLFIKDIYYYAPEDKAKKDPILIDNEVDKIHALKTLVPRDKRKIKKEYAESFGKYGLFLPYTTKCVNCGEAFDGEVNLLHYFFREVYTG